MNFKFHELYLMSFYFFKKSTPDKGAGPGGIHGMTVLFWKSVQHYLLQFMSLYTKRWQMYKYWWVKPVTLRCTVSISFQADPGWTPDRWYFLYFFILTFPLPLMIIISCYYRIFRSVLYLPIPTFPLPLIITISCYYQTPFLRAGARPRM